MPGRVDLVVPCFDEAARLAPAELAKALAREPDLALTLVDDGSRDGTRRVLDAIAAESPGRVHVVALPENRGKGEAVRAGLLAALARKPAFAGWWDADLATPFDELATLRAALEAAPRAWLATGARVRMLGAAIERRALRHYAGRVVATWISRALRLPVYDTQCGAKLFRADAVPAGLLDEPFLTRWLFDVEVLARLERLHRDGKGPPPEDLVVEVPLRRWTDVPGSKVVPLDLVRARFALGRIRRHYGIAGPRA
jgi:glycosyltransferase involved in cell wall biosynthesis